MKSCQLPGESVNRRARKNNTKGRRSSLSYSIAIVVGHAATGRSSGSGCRGCPPPPLMVSLRKAGRLLLAAWAARVPVAFGFHDPDLAPDSATVHCGCGTLHVL
ncbi:hypothetical protein J1614_002887 [Plenodomus biglobosus]|nr:hypothetical protein J1614_002887 [Plenodomus biglobosus]